jgi:hypothetical protein
MLGGGLTAGALGDLFYHGARWYSSRGWRSARHVGGPRVGYVMTRANVITTTTRLCAEWIAMAIHVL